MPRRGVGQLIDSRQGFQRARLLGQLQAGAALMVCHRLKQAAPPCLRNCSSDTGWNWRTSCCSASSVWRCLRLGLGGLCKVCARRVLPRWRCCKACTAAASGPACRPRPAGSGASCPWRPGAVSILSARALVLPPVAPVPSAGKTAAYRRAPASGRVRGWCRQVCSCCASWARFVAGAAVALV